MTPNEILEQAVEKIKYWTAAYCLPDAVPVIDSLTDLRAELAKDVCPHCKGDGEKYVVEMREGYSDDCTDCGGDGTLESYLKKQIADLATENERLKSRLEDERITNTNLVLQRDKWIGDNKIISQIKSILASPPDNNDNSEKGE